MPYFQKKQKICQRAIAQLAPISLRPIGCVCNLLIIKEIIELEVKKKKKKKVFRFWGLNVSFLQCLSFNHAC